MVVEMQIHFGLLHITAVNFTTAIVKDSSSKIIKIKKIIIRIIVIRLLVYFDF